MDELKELKKYSPEELAEKCAEEFMNSPEIEKSLLDYKYFFLFNATFDKLSALLIEKGILEKSEWAKIETECEEEAEIEFAKKFVEKKDEKKTQWLKEFEKIKAEMESGGEKV